MLTRQVNGGQIDDIIWRFFNKFSLLLRERAASEGNGYHLLAPDGFTPARISCIPTFLYPWFPPVSSFDEFTEFQSAPIPSVSTASIWDSKQGSAIGSRLANHNLGVKKAVDKVRRSTTGTKTVHINTQIRTSAPASLSYQSKDQPAIEVPLDLFPKCGVKNQSKTVILKDTVIRSNDSPKDYSDSFSNPPSISVEPISLSNDKETLPKAESTPKVINVLICVYN